MMVDILIVIAYIVISFTLAVILTQIIRDASKKHSMKKSKKILYLMENVYDDIKEDAKQRLFDYFESREDQYQTLTLNNKIRDEEYFQNVKEKMESSEAYERLMMHINDLKEDFEKKNEDPNYSYSYP